MKRPVIYTDLDGSLLDHYTYEATPAKSLLRQLDNLGTPVIPNSYTWSRQIDGICHLKAPIGAILTPVFMRLSEHYRRLPIPPP